MMMVIRVPAVMVMVTMSIVMVSMEIEKVLAPKLLMVHGMVSNSRLPSTYIA